MPCNGDCASSLTMCPHPAQCGIEPVVYDYYSCAPLEADMSEKAVALLPCPFCGGAMQPRDALWPSEGDTDGIIHAIPTDCPLPEFSVHVADDGVSVAEAWNKRAALPHLRAGREEIVQAFERLFPQYKRDGFTGGDRKDYEILKSALSLPAVQVEGRVPEGDLQRQLDDARALNLTISEAVVINDSYGVEGSGFQTCLVCQAGGAPNIPCVHDQHCAVGRAEEVARQWLVEHNEDIKELEDEITNLKAILSSDPPAPAPEGEWRDISSDPPPKNGKHILVCRGPYEKFWTFDQCPPAVVHWWSQPGANEDGFYLSSGGTDDDLPFEFTHWKSLREPALLVAATDGARKAHAHEIAMILCAVDGHDPDTEAPLTEMCDDANMPVPWWMVYVEYAEALLEKFTILPARPVAGPKDEG